MLPVVSSDRPSSLSDRAPRLFDQETRGYRCVPRQMRGDKSSNRSTSDSIVRSPAQPFHVPMCPITSTDPTTDLSSIDRFPRSICVYTSCERPTTPVYHTRFCLVYIIVYHDLIDDNRARGVEGVFSSSIYYFPLLFIPFTVNSPWKKIPE